MTKPTFKELVTKFGHAHDQSIGNFVFTVTNDRFASWIGVYVASGPQDQNLLVTEFTPVNHSHSFENEVLTLKDDQIQAAFEKFLGEQDPDDLEWV
jgi:hypothetical protein